MTLFTLGYEGLSSEAFVAWLERHRIDIVADVRKLPLSRKKGFSKTQLSKILESENIEYIGFSELGAPKAMRQKLYSTKNYKAFFREYHQEIQHKKEPIDKIINLLAKGSNIALLCFEHDPNTCHRKVLADEIKRRDGNGLKIMHLKPF